MMATAAVQEAAGRLLSGWDGIFVVLFLFITLIVAVSLNRSRLVISIIALYITESLLLLLSSPQFPRVASWLGGSGMAVGFLLTVAVITSSVLGSSVLKKTSRKKGDKKFSHRLVYAFVFLGLLLSMVVGRLPAEGFQSFAPLVWRLAGSPLAQVVWLILPLAAMLVWRRRRRRRR